MAADPVDIKAVIEKWAKMMFKETGTWSQKRIGDRNLQYSIKWDWVKFDHGNNPFTPSVNTETHPKTQVLFRTFFTNSTQQPQEYSFRTSKVTKSCCELTVDQAYTIGYEMNVSLKTPGKIFEANAGFHSELSLTRVQGEKVEEEMTWEVDTVIKVPEGKETTAELVVSENKYDGRFAVTTKISGKVHVIVTNLKDNNSLVKVIEGNIVEILRWMKQEPEFKKGLSLFEMENNFVKFTTRGNCNFRYAIEQRVHLHEEDIDGIRHNSSQLW